VLPSAVGEQTSRHLARSPFFSFPLGEDRGDAKRKIFSFFPLFPLTEDRREDDVASNPVDP